MAHVCKSLKELEKALQEKVEIALLTDVAETEIVDINKIVIIDFSFLYIKKNQFGLVL